MMTDSRITTELIERAVKPSNKHFGRLIWARTAVLIMTLLPVLLLLAGLFSTPRRPVDPIAVSTVFVLFVMTPGTAISALLMWWLIPRSRPLLRSCSIAVVFFVAALAWVGDFWLIGIGAGLKWHWLKWFALPTAIFNVLTACQWPRNDSTRDH